MDRLYRSDRIFGQQGAGGYRLLLGLRPGRSEPGDQQPTPCANFDGIASDH